MASWELLKRQKDKNDNFVLYSLRFAVSLHSGMKEVTIKDADLRRSAEEGMDAFLRVIIGGIRSAIGGELTSETMAELNVEQITLLAYDVLHDEVMDGGFVQLIHNGYGGFIFLNPFAKVLKLWGMRDLSKLIYNAHTLYNKYRSEIESECSDEEFMSMFERFSEFDDMDDQFVENEEMYTSQIAYYVDEHLDKFVRIEQ